MSWEDCGFKPGTIHGPDRCPFGACSECDAEHHFFYVACIEPELFDGVAMVASPENTGPTVPCFVCKHCEAWAEMVDET